MFSNKISEEKILVLHPMDGPPTTGHCLFCGGRGAADRWYHTWSDEGYAAYCAIYEVAHRFAGDRAYSDDEVDEAINTLTNLIDPDAVDAGTDGTSWMCGTCAHNPDDIPARVAAHKDYSSDNRFYERWAAPPRRPPARDPQLPRRRLRH